MPLRYSDFERSTVEKQREKMKEEANTVHCPKCDSQFFEEISVTRYDANHNIILGMGVPVKSTAMPYKFLKCIRCGDLLEPRIVHNSRDFTSGEYDLCLDTMEGKYDKRPKEAQVEQPKPKIGEEL